MELCRKMIELMNPDVSSHILPKKYPNGKKKRSPIGSKNTKFCMKMKENS